MPRYRFGTGDVGLPTVNMTVVNRLVGITGMLLWLLGSRAPRVTACPFSPQCACDSHTPTDITCDISRHGRPIFISHSTEIQRSVTIRGGNSLPDFFFRGLRVRTVRLRGLNLSSTGCSLLSGLEPFIQDLDLSHNVLQRVPTCTLAGLDKLTSLNLSENRIFKLERQDFAHVPHITRLELSGNLLPTLDGTCFVGLRNLVFLSLSRNRLSLGPVSDLSNVLESLETLDLSGNNLTHFGNTVMKTPALKYLYLGDNSLSMFALWDSVQNVKVLSLRKNRLEKLYEHVFKQYIGLEDLDLSDNLLHTVPPYLLTLPGLKRLSMARNQLNALDLKGIPINQMFSLLDFSENQISSVISGVIPAHYEFVLNMASNRISRWPTVAFSYGGNHTTVVKIDLSDNTLQKAPYFLYWRKFGGASRIHINLSNNSIDSLERPSLFTTLPSDRVATVSYIITYNRVNIFPPCFVSSFHRFHVLDLSFNQLTEVPRANCLAYGVKELVLNFNNLKRIRKLDFGSGYTESIVEKITFVGNNISVVHPFAFGQLSKSLQEIDLRHNRIKTLPAQVFTLPNLKAVHLKGNPLDCHCQQYRPVRTAFCRRVLDDSRCASPAEARGYLLTCKWRACSMSCDLAECASDHFVGIQTNISQLEMGFIVNWLLYGPGNWSHVRVNVTEEAQEFPVSIHIMNPDVNSYSFMYSKEIPSYNICVEALDKYGVALGGQCFLNREKGSRKSQGTEPGHERQGNTSDLNSTPQNSSTNVSLKIGIAIISLICVVCVIVLTVICYRRHKMKNDTSRPLELRNQSRRLGTGTTFLMRVLPCFSPYKEMNRRDQCVVLSDLLRNDSENRPSLGHSEMNPPRALAANVQPLLPPRNCDRDDVQAVKAPVSSHTPEEHQVSVCPGSSKLPEGLSEPSDKDAVKGSVTSSKHDGNDSSGDLCQNLYESGFHLRVQMDGPKAGFEESDNEHIYEDTSPMEAHTQKTSVHSPCSSARDGEAKTSREYSEPVSNSKPSAKVMPVLKPVMSNSDSGLGDYECPRSIPRIVEKVGQGKEGGNRFGGEKPPPPPPKERRMVILQNPIYEVERGPSNANSGSLQAVDVQMCVGEEATQRSTEC